MCWHFVSPLGILFLCIPKVSAIISTGGPIDMCSDIPETYTFSSDSNAFSLLAKSINIMPRNCTCEITTNRAIAVCITYACSPCRPHDDCPPDPCFCSNVSLTSAPTCTPTVGNQICQRVSYKQYSCDKSTKFTLNLFAKPLTPCSEDTNSLDLIIELLEPGNGGRTGKAPDLAFKEVRCNVRSVTAAAESTPNPDNAPTPTPTPTHMIIGIVVGIGGAVLLTTTIVIVVVVLRRRPAKSNKPHASDASQATPTAAAAAAAGEIAAYETYTVPVPAPMAAYDNATIGATSSYQTLAYDNEKVGESSDPYTEVKEPEERGNDNGYDNSRIGRNEVCSMYKEVGKDYDIIGVKPSTSTENETTVIDNEFYE